MLSTSHRDRPGRYRISTFHPVQIQFNQFLVKDDEPFLMHTASGRCSRSPARRWRQLIDPATLRWIGFSHFESDECGALNEWLAVAPRAAGGVQLRRRDR